MILIVMVIERKLLLAMRRIIGVVHIEDNGGRGLGVAGDEVIHQGARKTIEVFAVHLVLQPRECGGTREVVLRLQGGPLHPEFEQNPQSARRNNFPGEQISRWFQFLSENLSASNYPGAAFEQGVPTEVIGVIRVRIPGGDLIHALGQKIPQGMVNIGWVSFIAARSPSEN